MIKGLIPSVGVFAVSICLVSPVWAISNVIDFDADIPIGESRPISDFADVTFGKGGDSLINVWNFGRSGFSGNRMARGSKENADPYRADFKTAGVSFVSVVIGDAGFDEETLFLEAYDGNNGLLKRVDAFYEKDKSSGITLALDSKSSEISYVLFGSNGNSPNSVDFDDFTYSTDHNELPEPSSILLLGTGLAGLAAWRYKKSVLNK